MVRVRMLKLKSCSSELLMLSIVPTDTASYRLSFLHAHTHTHAPTHENTAAIPSCLCRQETAYLSLCLDLGVCVNALLSLAPMRGMFVVVP